MTTDLRAALRDAAGTLNTLAHRSESSDRHPLVDPDEFYHAAKQYRAIADAPPTVAELLPMVDATHEVRWEAHGEERRIYAPDGGTLATEYRTSRTRWTETRLTVFDLRRPARLVEVSP